MTGMLRAERGEVGLPQLLVAMVIFAGVLTATLSVFETFVGQDRALNSRNDSQESARSALDLLARDLRNLASPTPSQPDAFDRAGASDVIFKTVDTNGPNGGANTVNVQRVRYCLDSSTAGNAKLMMQTQTWTTATPPGAPATSACPGSSGAGWNGTSRVLVDHVSNYAGSQSRAIFSYNTSVLTDITQVHVELDLDLDIARSPNETTISTGVFLRNQNRRPTASFSWATNSDGIVLNGSASSDPEGQPLDYQWFDPAVSTTNPVGTGITFIYAVAKGSSHTITLKVFDPAKLEADATITGVTG